MYINDADDVYGNVGIGDNTLVFSNTEVCGSVRGWMHGNARAYNNASVCDNALVNTNITWVYGNGMDSPCCGQRQQGH